MLANSAFGRPWSSWTSASPWLEERLARLLVIEVPLRLSSPCFLLGVLPGLLLGEDRKPVLLFVVQGAVAVRVTVLGR